MLDRSYIITLSAATFCAILFAVTIGGEFAIYEVILTSLMNVFAVLIGFLSVVMVLTFEPGLQTGASAEIYERYLKVIRLRFWRQLLLFFGYLGSLLLSLVCLYLLEAQVNAIFEDFIRRLLAFLCTFSLILSFRLPKEILNIQSDRVELVLSDDELSRIEAIRRGID